MRLLSPTRKRESLRFSHSAEGQEQDEVTPCLRRGTEAIRGTRRKLQGNLKATSRQPEGTRCYRRRPLEQIPLIHLANILSVLGYSSLVLLTHYTLTCSPYSLLDLFLINIMGGGPDNGVALPSPPAEIGRIDHTGAMLAINKSCPATDCHTSSHVSVMTKLNDALSQTHHPDETRTVAFESHENAETDNADDVKITVTCGGKHSDHTVASTVQTSKADDQDQRLDPEFMIRQPDAIPMIHETLVAGVKGIYAGLVMVESKCIEMDNMHMPSPSDVLDVTRYLLTIPEPRLILLQEAEMWPANKIRAWFIKSQKDAIEEGKKWSNLQSNNDSPATSKDPSHPHVSTAPQVCSPDDYLRGFQVALELRAKELEWPEYEELVKRTAAETGEEGRKKVMEGQYFLNIGYKLVDQFLQDLEAAGPRREELIEARAAQERAQQAQQHDTEPRFKKQKRPPLVEHRPLHNQSLYKKVGNEYWVLVEGQWTISRNSEQWAALLDLHCNLLHEHCDLIQDSQHPVASAALKRLPAKYSMPARMWKHGMFSFLEIMRVRPSETHEFMGSFIISGYCMMSLLEETVPQFLSTWIECKADLARYG